MFAILLDQMIEFNPILKLIIAVQTAKEHAPIFQDWNMLLDNDRSSIRMHAPGMKATNTIGRGFWSSTFLTRGIRACAARRPRLLLLFAPEQDLLQSSTEIASRLSYGWIRIQFLISLNCCFMGATVVPRIVARHPSNIEQSK